MAMALPMGVGVWQVRFISSFFKNQTPPSTDVLPFRPLKGRSLRAGGVADGAAVASPPVGFRRRAGGVALTLWVTPWVTPWGVPPLDELPPLPSRVRFTKMFPRRLGSSPKKYLGRGEKAERQAKKQMKGFGACGISTKSNMTCRRQASRVCSCVTRGGVARDTAGVRALTFLRR